MSNYDEFVSGLESLGLMVCNNNCVTLGEGHAVTAKNGMKIAPSFKIDKALSLGMTPQDVKDALEDAFVPDKLVNDLDMVLEKPIELFWEVAGKCISDGVLSIPFLDFRAIPCIMMDDFSHIRIAKGLAERWGLSEKEVFDMCKVQQDWKIADMSEILLRNKDISEDLEEFDFGLKVVTNATSSFGASVLLDTDYLRSYWEKVGDFYILPSSRHEILILSVKDAYSFGDPDNIVTILREMVQQVNEDEVLASDFLSDSVFIFTEEGLHVA